MIEQIVVALGANALVLGALAFLVKSLLGQRLQKDISEFQSRLQLSAQREIEDFKAQLEKDRLRLQISYGGIFERQANAIIDLYKNALALERAASEAVNTDGPVSERVSAFSQSWASMKSSYHNNRILIPQNIDDKLGHFMDRMYKGVFGVVRVERRDLTRVTEEEFQRLSERQDQAYEIIDGELPALREELIASIRQTVGVASTQL